MKILFTVLNLTIFVFAVSAQQSLEHRCHVYVVDVEKAIKAQDNLNSEASEKALLSAETIFPEFITKIGEEELTTKNYPFPNSKLIITASIFYTDESLTSHPQDNFTVNDQSMIIGVMVSNKAQKSALSASTPNSSIAEVTFDQYTNVVRTKQYVIVGGRKFLLGLQCDCMAKRNTEK